VSWPVITLDTAAISLVFDFPRLRVGHRDASPPREAVCLFYELPPGLLVYGFTFSFVHRLWIMSAQVAAWPVRNCVRISGFIPTLPTGFPRFCTRCPQVVHKEPGATAGAAGSRPGFTAPKIDVDGRAEGWLRVAAWRTAPSRCRHSCEGIRLAGMLGGHRSKADWCGPALDRRSGTSAIDSFIIVVTESRIACLINQDHEAVGFQ
jgi:hypothetical protein